MFCCSRVYSTNDAMIYALVWVADIIFGCRCQDEIDKLRSRFFEQCKLDDRSSFSWFLGKQAKQSSGTVTVNQSGYIDDCLERFNLAECNPVGTSAHICRRRTVLKIGQQWQCSWRLRTTEVLWAHYCI